VESEHLAHSQNVIDSMKTAEVEGKPPFPKCGGFNKDNCECGG
jgi:hypothetical protein